MPENVVTPTSGSTRFRLPHQELRVQLDPALQRLGDQVVEAVRAAGEKAVAADAGQGTLTSDPTSLEHGVLAALRSLPEQRRTAVRARVLADLSRPRAVPLDVHADTSAERQVMPAASAEAARAVFRVPLPATAGSGKVFPFPTAEQAMAAKRDEHPWLGDPVTAVTVCPDGKGRFRHYSGAGGSVYWSPATGAHEVHGDIRSAWAALGWEKGYLGYPTSDEKTPPDQVGRFSVFQGGSVYWTPRRGAFAVRADVRDVWKSQGWELGRLGYPIENTRADGSQRFEGGMVQGGRAVYPRSRVEARLVSVKMLDETDAPFLGETGSDEMALGGVAVDQAGGTSEISRRSLGDFDEDGPAGAHTRTYDQVLHAFDLTGTHGWPKTCLVTTILAEIDDGDFTTAVKQLVAQVLSLAKEQVKEYARALGVALSEYIGAFGGLVGEALGQLGAYVLDALGSWFTALFDDVVFPPTSFTVTFADVWAPDPGPGTRVSSAGGGTYQTRVGFRLA